LRRIKPNLAHVGPAFRPDDMMEEEGQQDCPFISRRDAR